MSFWTFVAMCALIVCGGVGIFHPVFGVVVFGSVAVVLVGIFVLTAIPASGWRRR